jgi:mRNA interferase MazF
MATHKTPHKAQKVKHPRRGDIYLVDNRPAVVIQNDISNQHSHITIVAAITSKINEPPYPTEVILDPSATGLAVRSAALLNQIRSIDRRRLVKYLGRANSQALARIDTAIQISLGLEP